MKLETGHTAQQCSAAYHNQRVTNKPQKLNGHTDCAMSLKPRKQSVSLAPPRSAERVKGKQTSVRVATESGRSSTDGSESESNSYNRRPRERTMQSGRRKAKGHGTDATTSEESDMDVNHGNRWTKPRPPPEKVDNKKVLGTNTLDMSHLMRQSSQARGGKGARTMTHTGQTLQEGNGSKSLGDESEATREKGRCTSKIQTSSTDLDTGNELCDDCEQLKNKKMQHHHLKQSVVQ